MNIELVFLYLLCGLLAIVLTYFIVDLIKDILLSKRLREYDQADEMKQLRGRK